jgi:putative ABC transport system permease protein
VSIWESIRIALRALRSNKMRTGLTMLGIIIGVGAVIAMVALGQGAAGQIKKQFESMGTNLLTVRSGTGRFRPGGPGPGSGQSDSLTVADAEAIARKFPDTILAVAQVARGNGDVKLGSKSWSTSLFGVTADYATVAKLTVEDGRFISEQDERSRARVVVLGRSVIEQLKGDRKADMIGDTILVKRTRFRVVGILKERGSGGFGQDQDDLVIMPCQTAMRRVLNTTHLSEIDVSCRTEKDMDLATEQITSLLRQRHKVQPPYETNDDFNVRSPSQIQEALSATSKTMTTLLGGVALVSLLVGGIGIMNIMLVSVTERTREIGIRKAVGATNTDIMAQFLIEALVISVLGGAIGIILGGTTVALISHMTGWTSAIQVPVVVLSVLVSAGVGIFFGIFPAYRAAHLNPIEALRFE